MGRICPYFHSILSLTSKQWAVPTTLRIIFQFSNTGLKFSKPLPATSKVGIEIFIKCIAFGCKNVYLIVPKPPGKS